MTERNIVHDRDTHWVCRADGQYTVYRNTTTHSVADSSYRLNADGLSIAIARCNYLAARTASGARK